MKKQSIELIVGIFLLIGLLCMAYISVNLGRVELLDNNYYPVKATFTSVNGLKKNTNISISGVIVGKVKDIELVDYQAIVTLHIKNGIEIQDDAIASINTNGILGEKFIQISPGASDVILKAGDTIFDTEPPFDLLSVIKNLVIDD